MSDSATHTSVSLKGAELDDTFSHWTWLMQSAQRNRVTHTKESTVQRTSFVIACELFDQFISLELIVRRWRSVVRGHLAAGSLAEDREPCQASIPRRPIEGRKKKERKQ